MGEETCDEILRIAFEKRQVKVINLIQHIKEELFIDEQKKGNVGYLKITTNCEALDKALNYGFPIGKICEIYGEAGTGKTQLCMQLCCTVQLPRSIQGLESESLYIDTEGRFMTPRILEMGEGLRDKHSVSLDNLLDKIHLIRITSPQLFNFLIIHRLEEFLDEHPKVKLIVLDSIAFQFRYGYDADFKERTRALILIAEKLRKIVAERLICVVIANQLTCNMDIHKSTPALGETWSHTASTRIHLEKAGNVRKATLVKSYLKKPCEVFYKITPQGITDATLEELKCAFVS
jgi:RAD51-like protein 2